MTKTQDNSSGRSVLTPKAETISILRQFARAYMPTTAPGTLVLN